MRKYVTSSRDEKQNQAYIENSDIIISITEIYKVMSFVYAHTVCISAFCACIYALFCLTYYNELTKSLKNTITLTQKKTGFEICVSQGLVSVHEN